MRARIQGFRVKSITSFHSVVQPASSGWDIRPPSRVSERSLCSFGSRRRWKWRSGGYQVVTPSSSTSPRVLLGRVLVCWRQWSCIASLLRTYVGADLWVVAAQVAPAGLRRVLAILSHKTDRQKGPRPLRQQRRRHACLRPDRERARNSRDG